MICFSANSYFVVKFDTQVYSLNQLSLQFDSAHEWSTVWTDFDMICVTSNQKWPIDLIHKNLLILYATLNNIPYFLLYQ